MFVQWGEPEGEKEGGSQPANKETSQFAALLFPANSNCVDSGCGLLLWLLTCELCAVLCHGEGHSCDCLHDIVQHVQFEGLYCELS